MRRGRKAVQQHEFRHTGLAGFAIEDLEAVDRGRFGQHVLAPLRDDLGPRIRTMSRAVAGRSHVFPERRGIDTITLRNVARRDVAAPLRPRGAPAITSGNGMHRRPALRDRCTPTENPDCPARRLLSTHERITSENGGLSQAGFWIDFTTDRASTTTLQRKATNMSRIKVPT